MTSTVRTMFLLVAFALVAGSLLAGAAGAKVKDRRGFDRPIFDGPIVTEPANPDPCAEAEDALDGFLPETVTLKKSDSFWAKMTVKDGVSALQCDLGSPFEVRFNNVGIKTYGKALGIGGWNHLASISCAVRVKFAVGFSPPNTVILSNLTVLAVNCDNSPNWLDSSLVKKGLNAIFPSSIVFQV